VLDWATLRELIDQRDVASVAAALRDLPPAQRRLLAEPLKRYERRIRNDPLARDRQPALAVAGAAVLPGAAALAPWLTRNDLVRPGPGGRRKLDATEAVLGVLRDRRVSWLPDLARHLADRLPVRRGDGRLWPLVRRLVSVTGMEPPASDGFVFWWVRERICGGVAVVEEIRRDPRLTALIPRIFEVDEAAALLDPPQARDVDAWPLTLRALAAEGLVDRALLLDSCVAGLARGSRLGALRGFLRVHEELAPTLGEVAARVRDYLALLPGSHSTVARLAQDQLRRLDDAGMLDFAALREAGQAVLARAEKTLIRAQLDWLDIVARRDPGRAGDAALTMTLAFGQQAADLQARALTLVLRHASRLDQAARAKAAQAASALPADLRTRAAKVLGQVTSADPGPAPVLMAPAVRGLPPPISSPEELAALVAALHVSPPDSIDPVDLERALAGLAAICHASRPALAVALEPFLARHPYIIPGHPVRAPTDMWPGFDEGHELAAIIAAAVVTTARTGRFPDVAAVAGGPAWQERLDDEQRPGPQRWLLRRLHEIAIGLAYAPRPLLLSTPTSSTGLIEPDALLCRVRRAADEGWEPWPLDLAQALARLPRDPDPVAAARAAAIGSPAAAALAARLSAGTPADPGVTVVLCEVRPSRYSWDSAPVRAASGRILAEVHSSAPDEPGDPCGLAGELPAPQQWPHGYADQNSWLSCWPAVLPAHRDVVAAHLVPHLYARTIQGRDAGALLPSLARTDGPVGPGLNLALGYGLAARDQAGRSAAVDAMTTLAGRGQLDGAALGGQIGALAACGQLALGRLVPGLRDVAGAGAQAQVWSLVAAALPCLLPPTVESPPQRIADLIALGVDLAQSLRPAQRLPCLEPVAARRGSSQLILQARRLRQALL
jgi:hypothetical protein